MLQPPKPTAPFCSLLGPDFTSGTPEQDCEFTNFVPNQPKPPKVVAFGLKVRYASPPDTHAVDEARKQVDTRTYDHPTDLPGLGDTAPGEGLPGGFPAFVTRSPCARL